MDGSEECRMNMDGSEECRIKGSKNDGQGLREGQQRYGKREKSEKSIKGGGLEVNTAGFLYIRGI